LITSEDKKAILAYLAVCFFWGSTYLAIRIGVQVVPPFIFAATRLIIAGALVLIYSKIKGYDFPKTKKEYRRISIVGILLLVGGNGLVVFSEQWLPSGIASLIVACVPLFMAIIEVGILKMKRISLRGVLGLIIGFGGVVFLVLNGGIIGETHFFGVIIILIATFSWSAGSVYSKTFKLDCSIIVSIGIQMLVAGIVLFAVGAIRGEISQVEWTMQGILSIVYLITFGSIVGYSSYIYVLSKWPAARAGTYAYVNPIVAVILGSIFLQEKITVNMVISMFVILTGVLLVQKSKIDNV
jgi:drug/metabolite transporter (DMT)-like permease